MLTIEDRKELAEVLRDLAVLIKEDTRISSHAPIEVVNEVHILVNRVAAKYRRWADALVSEEEEEEEEEDDERPIEPSQEAPCR